METIYYGQVPPARDRRPSKGRPEVVLRATRGDRNNIPYTTALPVCGASGRSRARASAPFAIIAATANNKEEEGEEEEEEEEEEREGEVPPACVCFYSIWL